MGCASSQATSTPDQREAPSLKNVVEVEKKYSTCSTKTDQSYDPVVAAKMISSTSDDVIIVDKPLSDEETPDKSPRSEPCADQVSLGKATPDKKRQLMSVKSNRFNLVRSIGPVGAVGDCFSTPLEEDLLEDEVELFHTSKLTIQCTGERKELSIDRIKQYFVHISIEAPPAVVNADHTLSSRAPADVVCIVDVSQTMIGLKMDLVLKCLTYISAQLTDLDRLTVIAFDSTAQVIHGLSRMTPENKESSITRVRNFFNSRKRADFKKDLFSGLHLAAFLLSSRETANAISPIIMFTDGYDHDPPHGTAFMEICKTIRAAGATFVIFGVLHTPRIDHLREMATVAEGYVCEIKEKYPESNVAAVLGALFLYGGQEHHFAGDGEGGLCLSAKQLRQISLHRVGRQEAHHGEVQQYLRR